MAESGSLPSEADEARWLASELDARELFWTHVPNERVRKIEAVRLARQGVTAGIPDVLVFEARALFHGMALELKRRSATKSALTKAQRRALRVFQAKGWHVAVAYGWKQAVMYVDDYLSSRCEWAWEPEICQMQSRRVEQKEVES